MALARVTRKPRPCTSRRCLMSWSWFGSSNALSNEFCGPMAVTLKGGDIRVPYTLKVGELRLEVVLLRLQGIGGVDERGVVADGELAALGLGAPLQGDQQPKKNGRDEEHERVLELPRSWCGSGRHALKCPCRGVCLA